MKTLNANKKDYYDEFDDFQNPLGIAKVPSKLKITHQKLNPAVIRDCEITSNQCEYY